MKQLNHLNIAMVIDSYENASNGAVVSTRRFVELLRKDHNVKVITNGNTFEGQVGLPPLNIPVAKSKIEDMGFSFAKPDRRVLRAVIQWADIVHVQFPFLLGRAALNLCKKLNKPVVTSFHVQPENMLFNVGIRSEKLTNIMYRYFIRDIYNKSMKVICPTSFAASELERRGLQKETAVISNGVLPEFSPTFWMSNEKQRNYFTILSVGRLASEKSHEVLIEAVKRSKYAEKINLIISGKGPLAAYLKNKARCLHNPPIIDFLPYRLLIQAYQEADLYVHASEVELESMTVLEAMACGLPPLIADSPLSAAPGFALNRKFLFKPNSAEDLAEQIDFWYENRSELERYRYRYAQEAVNLKIEKSHQKLLSTYRSVIARHRLAKNYSLLTGHRSSAENSALEV